MSDPLEKNRNTRRRHKDEIAIQRQIRIAKRRNSVNSEDEWSILRQPHRLAKRHAMDCGNTACYLCGNRRKYEGLSIQEQRLFQDTEMIRERGSNGSHYLQDEESDN